MEALDEHIREKFPVLDHIVDTGKIETEGLHLVKTFLPHWIADEGITIFIFCKTNSGKIK